MQIIKYVKNVFLHLCSNSTTRYYCKACCRAIAISRLK